MKKYFHQYYLDQLTSTSKPLGCKPAQNQARINEARRLSMLVQDSTSFSFIRMGDMQLTSLLAFQDGIAEQVGWEYQGSSGTSAAGNLGIGSKHIQRVWNAFENASYVDFHQCLWPINILLPRLRLRRRPGLHENPNEQTSYLLPTWLEYEYAQFCQGRRIGIYSPDAKVLRELMRMECYVEIAGKFRGRPDYLHMPDIRGGGRYLDNDIDEIMSDIVHDINEHNLDTVFISLGGAAKILCYEIARHIPIIAFDFGAMLRALTYSGSPGNKHARGTHTPFLYRVPFATYMDAIERAFPEMTPLELLCKAHAQLILEVQKKEVGWTHTAWEYDFSHENLAAFHESHEVYLKRYRRLFDASPECRRERKNFLWFCGQHGLTAEGRAYYWAARAKGAMLGLLGRRK